MGTVAEGHGFGMFASAPRDRSGFLNFCLQGTKAGAFMGTVTKRLAFGSPAGTPPINAGFDLLDDGTFLKDNWIVHNLIPLLFSVPGSRLV